MEEKEIKLVRGASFKRDSKDGKGFKIQKGQTMFFPKEQAKELVGSGRFVYTDQERGSKMILCPHCKRELDVNSADEVAIKTGNDNTSLEAQKKNNKHVCAFCLRDDFATPAEMKKHLKDCECNPTVIAKKAEKGITSKDLNNKKDK